MIHAKTGFKPLVSESSPGLTLTIASSPWLVDGSHLPPSPSAPDPCIARHGPGAQPLRR